MSDEKLKTRKEVADELGLNRRTIYNRCKEKGIPTNRKRLTPEEVKKIKS